MIRSDWCIAAFVGTVFVGSVFRLACVLMDSNVGPEDGFAAIFAGYAVTMMCFVVRMFSRMRRGSAVADKPIQNGVRAALLAGLACGVCISIGVAIALGFAVDFSEHSALVSDLVSALLAAICACGLLAVPLGFASGALVWLFHWWRLRS